MSGFALHPEVFNDLEEIRRFIADNNPDAADLLMAELFNAMRSLVKFPGKGHRRSDLTTQPLRFIVVQEYLVAYVPEDDPLWIVSVIHGRRNPRVIAAALRSRSTPS
jgi:plasmid stabilization system protein ParE